jgi:MoxR-like ATPase
MKPPRLHGRNEIDLGTVLEARRQALRLALLALLSRRPFALSNQFGLGRVQ